MAAISMPFRKEKSTLNIIDKVSPGCKLTCYISDVEGLFICYTINTDADKKKWFIYYPGLIISEFWESLPEYSDAEKTYEIFKNVVVAQYPDASITRNTRDMISNVSLENMHEKLIISQT